MLSDRNQKIKGQNNKNIQVPVLLVPGQWYFCGHFDTFVLFLA